MRGFRWSSGECPLWNPRPWLVCAMLSFRWELKGLGHCEYCWEARCDKVAVLGISVREGGHVPRTGLFLEALLFRIRLWYGCNFYKRIGRKPKPSEVSELGFEVTVDLQLQRVLTSIRFPTTSWASPTWGSLSVQATENSELSGIGQEQRRHMIWILLGITFWGSKGKVKCFGLGTVP